jgi:hypothetical protein
VERPQLPTEHVHRLNGETVAESDGDAKAMDRDLRRRSCGV